MLNFDFYKCEVNPVKDEPLCFNLVLSGTERIFHLKAASVEESQKWQEALLKEIYKSEGMLKNLRISNDIKKPWKFDNMSEKQFLNKANTGDLLLFRGSQAGSMITRTLTGSHFDHVAMVLKF